MLAVPGCPVSIRPSAGCLVCEGRAVQRPRRGASTVSVMGTRTALPPGRRWGQAAKARSSERRRHKTGTSGFMKRFQVTPKRTGVTSQLEREQGSPGMGESRRQVLRLPLQSSPETGWAGRGPVQSGGRRSGVTGLEGGLSQSGLPEVLGPVSEFLHTQLPSQGCSGRGSSEGEAPNTQHQRGRLHWSVRDLLRTQRRQPGVP